MILVASETSDPTGQAILAALRQRGQACHLLDFRFFPQRDGIVYALSAQGRITRSYRLDALDIDLDGVRSVFWRRPAWPKAAPALADGETREYVETSSAEVLSGVFEDLGCFQVPASRQVLKAAHAKIPQLSLAARLGFELPATLVTNTPEEFLDFYRRHDGRVITKPAAVSARPLVNGLMTGYARLVRPIDMVHFRDIRLCPLIVQAYVEKAVEVRVTVVGPDVFAAEIHSQAAHRTKVDWRRYDEGNTPYFVHALPDAVADRCRQITAALGLVYAAIDLVVTPDGRHVFLELNPNGQYQWIEHLTGLPITERIARLLIDRS